MTLQQTSTTSHELPRNGAIPQLAALALSAVMTLAMLASVDTLATSAPPQALWAQLHVPALPRA
ncbi:MAG: hypothetical protein KGN16_05140 [Burkholderiales bacterium]|nr:hypothetical protein [Burkholderiales bacterium]